MLRSPLGSLYDIFKKISESRTLYIPTDSENVTSFKKWEEGVLTSAALNTTVSPKAFFFPQSEDLVHFTVSDKSISVKDIRKEKEEFVLFGVRACDARALDVLDRVFLDSDEDSYYSERRKKATVITLACTKPSESCFCTVFGIDPSVPEGDISVWKTDSHLFWQANTKKGEVLLESLSDMTEKCQDNEVSDLIERIRKTLKKLPLSFLNTEAFGAGKTMELFESEKWDRLSQSCLGCGSCTYVCPTCQCYDIKDIDTGKGVIRYRCWDSCMYSEFTKMAHGNPRPTQKERFRQRFMHKLVYFPENNEGLFSCVGCGRCITACPISMNIAKVMKTLGGTSNE